jgi:glycosyltransferase involved in cell wall biosynthesis
MNDTQPLVSIVIPTFHRCELAVQAIESIRSQTFPRWEAIVVDDGSSDETRQRFKTLAGSEPRIRLLQRTRPPKGAATCRNIGLQAACGDYIIFLDSDDVLGPACLEHRVRALQENPEADFLVFPVRLFHDETGDSRLLWNIGTAEPDLQRFLRGDSVWPINGPIWRKPILTRLGGCDESLACWQDVDLHVRALLLRPNYVKLLREAPDAFVRRHQAGSISQDGLRGREAAASIVRVFQKVCAALGTAAGNDIRDSLRATLMHGLEASMDSGQFDLARDALAAARRSLVLTKFEHAVWRLTLLFYQRDFHRALGGRCLRDFLAWAFRRRSKAAARRHRRSAISHNREISGSEDPCSEAHPARPPFLERTWKRWQRSCRKRFGPRSG